MKSHITNKQLAGYMAHSLGDRAQNRIAGHLAQCDRCRARHAKMLAAAAPRYHTLRASDAAKIRVMRSRDKLAENESAYAPRGLRSLLALHPRAVLAASLALVAAVVVSAALLFRPPAVKERPYLAATVADAGITINGHGAGAGAKVFEHSSISLPDKSMMRLELGPGFAITLVGPADFSIDRLLWEGPSKTADLECTLSQGILVSASNGPGGNVAYAYNTPNARIEPAGTEFLLQAAGGSTLVLMKTGSVSVKSAGAAEGVTVSAGKRCMVSEKPGITQAAPEDLKIFGNMEQLRSGGFGPRLLKPEKESPRKEPGEGGPGSSRNSIRQEPQQKMTGITGTGREKADRRNTTANPVKPGLGEREQLIQDKKLIRETQRSIRQNRRTRR